MTIHFPCAGCGRGLQVPESGAGHSVRCPLCQLVQNAPAAEGPVDFSRLPKMDEIVLLDMPPQQPVEEGKPLPKVEPPLAPGGREQGSGQAGAKVPGGSQADAKALGGSQAGAKALGGTHAGARALGGGKAGAKALGGSQAGAKALGGSKAGVRPQGKPLPLTGALAHRDAQESGVIDLLSDSPQSGERDATIGDLNHFLRDCLSSPAYGLRCLPGCVGIIFCFLVLYLILGAPLASLARQYPGGLAVLVWIVQALFGLLAGGYFLEFLLTAVNRSVAKDTSMPTLPEIDLGRLMGTGLRGAGIFLVFVCPVVTLPLLPLGLLALAVTGDGRAFDLRWAARAAAKCSTRLFLLWVVLIVEVVIGILAAAVVYALVSKGVVILRQGLGSTASMSAWTKWLVDVSVLIVVGLLLLPVLVAVLCSAYRCIGFMGRHSPEILVKLPLRRDPLRALAYLAVSAMIGIPLYMAVGSRIMGKIVAFLLWVLASLSVFPPGPTQPQPLAGTIVSVDTISGNVVVQSKDGAQVTVPTDANTAVKIDGKVSTLGGLAPGMVVVVKPGTGTAKDIDATSPPPPEPGPPDSNRPPVDAPPSPLAGEIVSVDTTTGKVVVQSKDGPQVTTVATDAKTVVKIDGKVSTLGNLTAGMFVEVKPGTGTAEEIDATSPPRPLAGRIVGVDTTTGKVVVQSKDGAQVTVATDAKTVVKIDGKVSTLGYLSAGMIVEVKPGTGVAKEIDATSPPLTGKIVSVDAATGNLVVQRKDGAQVTVATDARTVVKIDGNVSILGELRPDMLVVVKPGTGTAREIDAKPPPPPLTGKIVSVDAAAGKVVVQRKDGAQVIVGTDPNTIITLDGKDSSLGKLTAGMSVVVNPGTGTAEVIDAASPWNVKPDPGPVIQIKPDLSITYLVTGPRDVIVPTRPSQYVLITSGKIAGGWEVWDLQKGTKGLNMSGTLEMDDMTLAPDGILLGGTRKAGTAGGTATAEVWSLKTLDLTTKVNGIAGFLPPKVLGFVEKNRVLILHENALRQGFVRVHDMPAGRPTAEFQFPPGGAQMIRLSPTGAYVVLGSADQLQFFDSGTGELCGIIALTNWKHNGQAMPKTTFRGATFSPDGREFALLYAGPGATRIVAHDMGSGDKTVDITYAEPGPPANGMIDYIPGVAGWRVSGWLVSGDTVVRRAGAAPSHTFPKVIGLLFSRMATARQLLQVVKTGSNVVFQTLDMPPGAR